MNTGRTPLRESIEQLGRDFTEVLTGQRFAIGAVLGLWIGDAVLLAATRAGATWAQWVQGMGGAAFVALSTALVVGGLLGPLVVPLGRQLADRAGAGWTGVRRGEVDARHAFLALVLALPVMLILWAGGLYRLAIAIVFGFARPESIALAMAVSDILVTLLLLVVWPSGVRGARVFVESVSRSPRWGWFVGRAWPMPAAIAIGGLLAMVKIIAVQWPILAALPWLGATPLLGLVLGAAVAAYLPSAPSWVRRGALGLTALVLASGLVAALRMRPESSTAQALGFGRALSGRAGYAAWTLALDVDRDGQMSVLGGGDCAPFDPRRYTGAPELPGDGIDEDCDGVDEPAARLDVRPPLKLDAGAPSIRSTVILVTVDALAGPELSALGAPRPTMPRVNELASRSMLFSRCFAQGPSTRLSFPSIFTSRWDSQQAFEVSSRLPYSFSERERTLQQAFDDAGYETVAVIPNVYFARSRWPSLTNRFERVVNSAISARAGKHNAREVTDAALRVLAEERERPLYLWIHYYDAHPPYGSPPGASSGQKDDLTYYEQELGYIDRQLGRLIDAVNARPDPTYLVLSADHATSFHPVPASRHYHYGYDIYTSTLHVPLVFHGPGLRTGRNDHVVSTMDIAPTLANLLSLDDQGRFEGTSLAPELINGVEDAGRITFHEYYLPERGFSGAGDPLEFVSLRTDRYDLILNRNHGTYELYEWSVDYYEQHGLYEEQSRSPEVAHLRSVLGTFLQTYAPRLAASTRTADARSLPGLGESFPAMEE